MVMELEIHKLYTLKEHLQSEEFLKELFLEVMALHSPYILCLHPTAECIGYNRLSFKT